MIGFKTVLERKELEKKAAEKRNAQIESQLLAARRKREAAMPSDTDRRAAAVAGLRLAHKRFVRGGDGRAEKLDAIAEQAAALHVQYVDQTRQLSEPKPDLLREAAEPIATKLQKAVGGFDDAEQAVNFVLRFWPLTAARRRVTLQADTYAAACRERTMTGRKFWAVVEKGAALAHAESSNPVRTLVDAGLLA